MQHLEITVSSNLSQEMAKMMGQIMAEEGNPESIVIAWCNYQTKACSP